MVDLHDGYDEVLDHRKMRKPKTTSDELIERQFELIVEGLQVEYAGKLNGLKKRKKLREYSHEYFSTK